MLTYEAQLAANLTHGLHEGSMHFDEKSSVFASLHKITSRLSKLHISHVVVGGMALFAHGVRRFTEDVDLLVTPAGLEEAHRQLDGLGYMPPFKGSKQLRDAATGVRIEFLVTGQFPGDGKPKPVAFPDPEKVAVEINNIRYLNLPNLIDLKLASGMTNAGRLKDLADVQELIKALALPLNYAEQLNPYTREKFQELCHAVIDTREQE